MAVTNRESGTRIDEIEDGIFKIHTPVPAMPGGFSFNQYLVFDVEPLLFHTGPRKMFPLVREAIAHVMPIDRLRWISFSHFEADECGALNEILAVAPDAQPLCSNVAAMVSVDDVADRAARGMIDGETLSIGKRTLTWIDTPHLPHAWECGVLADVQGGVLFCGDLFTQPGADHAPITEADILGPSEAFRGAMDYFSHTRRSRALIDKLARLEPRTLACMHGAAWRGDGAKLLGALGDVLDP
ncbi:MAG: MBL fold metallo-hydrolase [Labilithrix sp.]|nr:MBL fold metallo-hydrolase [Labilithrix sp.]